MGDKPKPVEVMPQLHKEIRSLSKMSRLTSAVEDVDKVIALLTAAREQIASAQDPHSVRLIVTKLQNPVSQGCEAIFEDLSKVSKVQKKLGKSLEKSFPETKIPSDHDVMEDQTALINRAIAIHLLREGQFSVASTFISESEQQDATSHPTDQFLENEEEHERDVDGDLTIGSFSAPDTQSQHAGVRTGTTTGTGSGTAPGDLGVSLQSQELQAKFADMYNILQALRQEDLSPAIEWARANSEELERRGSNLEFELCKLQYVHLFRTGGPAAAYEYARSHMDRFQARHLNEIQQLAAALVYAPNLPDSPYASLFDSPTAFSDVAAFFTREFCSLLGLSAESPLYVATTAGAIALPQLVKYMKATKAHGAEWTTADELAFETPLPRSFMYHSVFVCPVSKEQTTSANPPMILKCGHVLARESMQKLAKGSRFKCPYCPTESSTKEAKLVIL